MVDLLDSQIAYDPPSKSTFGKLLSVGIRGKRATGGKLRAGKWLATVNYRQRHGFRVEVVRDPDHAGFVGLRFLVWPIGMLDDVVDHFGQDNFNRFKVR